MKKIEFMNHLPSNVTEESPIYLMHGVYPERPWIVENSTNCQEIISLVNDKLQNNDNKYIKPPYETED